MSALRTLCPARACFLLAGTLPGPRWSHTKTLLIDGVLSLMVSFDVGSRRHGDILVCRLGLEI